MARRRPPTRSTAFANALRRHQVGVFRFVQHMNTEEVQSRLIGVRADLVRLVVDGDPTAPSRQGDQLNRVDALAIEARRRTRRAYRTMRTRVNAELSAWAGDEQHVVAQMAVRAAGVPALDVLPARTLNRIVDRALIQGSPAAEWWAKQADDLAFRFAATVREGTRGGEPIGQIVQRVRGTAPRYADSIIRASQHQAEALVRSSVLSALHDTRTEQFRRNRDVVEGWTVLTAFDTRVCARCMGFSGAMYDHDGDPLPDSPVNVPLSSDGLPIHIACRCMASPLLAGEAAPDDLDFTTWFRQQPAADQREILGPGWYAAWKSGDLRDLRERIDQRGRPLSLRAWREHRGVTKEAA